MKITRREKERGGPDVRPQSPPEPQQAQPSPPRRAPPPDPEPRCYYKPEPTRVPWPLRIVYQWVVILGLGAICSYCSKPQGANHGTLLHIYSPPASIVQQDPQYDKPPPRAELVKLPPGTHVTEPAFRLEVPRVVEPPPRIIVEP